MCVCLYWVCDVCMCKGHNRHNYLCLRGPVGRGWRSGCLWEAEFNNGSTTGFVCTEQRADKCQLLLTIYTPLDTLAHVHGRTQKCTHSIAGPIGPPCLFFFSIKHTQTHGIFTVHQCISVNQYKRERWESPCEHITLTEIWTLTHPSSPAVWEHNNWERQTERWRSEGLSYTLPVTCLIT